MRKSISKAILFMIAVVTVLSAFGITTAFAADPPSASISIADGNITVNKGTGNNITVTYGAPQVTSPEFDSGQIITVTGTSTTNTVTVADAATANIKLNGAAITAPTGKAALAVGTGAAVNLTTDTASTLTGGISGSFSLSAGTLTVSGGIGGSLTVTGGTVTLQNGTVSGTTSVTGGKLTIGKDATIPAKLTITSGILTAADGNTVLYKTVITLPTGNANTNISYSVDNSSTYKPVTTDNSGAFTVYMPVKAGDAKTKFIIKKLSSEIFEVEGKINNDHNNRLTAAAAVCTCSLTDAKLTPSTTEIIIPAGATIATIPLNPSATGNSTGCILHPVGTTVTYSYVTEPLGKVIVDNNLTVNNADAGTQIKVTMTAKLGDQTQTAAPVTFTVKKTVTLAVQDVNSIRHNRDFVIRHDGGVGFSNAMITGQLINGGSAIDKAYYTVTENEITVKGDYPEITAGNSLSISAVANNYPVTPTLSITVLKNIGTIQQPADITGKVGTSFANLALPKKVKVILDGNSNDTIDCDVNWVQGSYNSNSTSRQSISGSTLLNIPSHVSIANRNVAINVTLRRASTGGSSSKEPNYEYEFWMDIKDKVIDADSGDTVRVYAKSYDNIPAVILEKLKGRSITLIIERDKGKDITIYGKNVKKVESNRIYYTLSELETLYKNAGKPDASSSSSVSSSSASSKPTVVTPIVPSTPSVSSSQSSSESSSESSQAVDSSSEEELEEPSEPVDVDPEPEPDPERKKMSPLLIVVLITVIVAAISGIVACIVLQRKKFN
ncbi:hypothetical protein [Hydrogenoanaerobacterium sp.]|uniref:hypothetical protein n=1 Tax=Hydrogenoanaerobacterium sp. TaxID=2953763 RepID=UPI0028985CC4|nr:hypothetical protein [Hydrogenoanaerobacterium sp.]